MPAPVLRVRPEAVLLDWDGTLADSYEFLKTAHNHVRERLGEPIWNDAQFREVLRFSTRDIYPKLYGQRWEEARDILNLYVDEHHAAALKPAAHAEDLLQTLQGLSIPAGVISNKGHARLCTDIERLGWGRYFRLIAGAGTSPRDKPAPDMMVAALDLLGLAAHPEKILYAGDMQTDLEFARGSGVGAVFLLHGMGEPGLADIYRPLYVFDDCSAFMLALKALDGGA